MIITSITVQGFKSFARPTSLRFGGGVTAIVGPNGSGKSNLADALRWVLGEQSVKALRVKKTEDLIFAGTTAKARGSLAEVRVLFDNSEGTVLPELAEIELSRKLYGSGESDYRLNGRKVRLGEVQELLARARIGAGSYAIISQGTIDSLILATPAERKLLFEEASGIKEFELQRGGALKRLRATEENMQRARDVLAELAPRLASLERSQQSAQKCQELEAELGQLRAGLAAAQAAELEQRADEVKRQIAAIQLRLDGQAAELAQLNARQKAATAARAQAEQGRKQAVTQLHRLEASREQLVNDQSVQQAELAHLQERLGSAAALQDQIAELDAELGQQKQLRTKLAGELKAAQADQAAVVAEREAAAGEGRRLQQRLVRQRHLLRDESQGEYVAHAHAMMTDVHHALQDDEIDKEQLQALTYRVRRLLKLATEHNRDGVVERLHQLQNELGAAMRLREAIDERYTQATLQLRSCELDLATADRERDELTAQRQAVGAEIKQTERAATYARQHEAVIAKLQVQLQENQREIDSRRAELSAAGPLAVDEAVAIARELERTTAARQATTTELKAAQQEQRQLEKSLAKLPKAATTASSKRPTETAAALQQRIIQAESRLAAARELSQDVTEEYSETKQRHDFLQQQLHDLESAQENLHTIIAQLSSAIQTQFTNAFAEISTRFGTMVQTLFGGGAARLTLHDSDEQDVGIEVEVQPPGKRVRQLTALSGGERSLAGIALLAAIVQVNPSPILVLDEVDAALDETNAAQFSRLLTELAESSQIVVITHNRQTMLAASVLFGVTMDAEHVSQTVSIQLDEAAELAAATG